MSFYFNRFNCLSLFNGLVFYAPVSLLVDIPSVILSKYENDLINSIGAESNRATVLSVFSMGGSLPEIAMLLVSSALAGAGVAVCFIALGVAIAVLGTIFVVSKRKTV